MLKLEFDVSLSTLFRRELCLVWTLYQLNTHGIGCTKRFSSYIYNVSMAENIYPYC